MNTPYLIAKGAIEAKAELQKALGTLEDIQSLALEDNAARTNKLKEPIEQTWKHLAAVNEWLTAIEGKI